MGRRPRLPDKVKASLKGKAKTSRSTIAVRKLEKTRESFLEIWSDPLDTRTEEEMAEELKVELSQLRTWRRDPIFYETATKRFKESFNANTIPVLRNLVSLAIRYKSLSASKLLLQAMGAIQDGGLFVQINNNGGNGKPDDISKMDDDTLDREINRLSAEVYPLDVRLCKGKMYPIEDAYVEEVKDADSES